jgi:hypothetical protein
VATADRITNLRWCLWHLDGVNSDLIEALDRDDTYLLEKLAAFRQALSSVHDAVSLLTTEERARLERATSSGWFDRLRVHLASMSRWCRNELGATGDISLELLRGSAAVHRIGHSIEQIDSFRKMDEELAVTFREDATATAEKVNKTGNITDADRLKVEEAIVSYRKQFGGTDPTSQAIQQRTELGPNKISEIMKERRVAGQWAVPARPRKKT